MSWRMRRGLPGTRRRQPPPRRFRGNALRRRGDRPYGCTMPPQNPLTRLEQVALGLEQLATELTDLTGEPPKNLVWWREEILDVVRELSGSDEDRGLQR